MSKIAIVKADLIKYEKENDLKILKDKKLVFA